MNLVGSRIPFTDNDGLSEGLNVKSKPAKQRKSVAQTMFGDQNSDDHSSDGSFLEKKNIDRRFSKRLSKLNKEPSTRNSITMKHDESTISGEVRKNIRTFDHF